MSYNSKRTIASMVAGVLLVTAYIIYALGEHSPAPSDLKSWAIAMLVFIGISVVAVIVIQIVFHIASAVGIAIKEKYQEHSDEDVERNLSSLMVEDERDKLISLKSSHIGYIFAGIGFVAALAGLAFGVSGIVALHILFGAFAIGSIAEGIATVCFYEKGVRNG
jgi:hypothetical protein